MSLKLKRGEVSAAVGEEGPALDTVLEGPLLSAGERGGSEDGVGCGWCMVRGWRRYTDGVLHGWVTTRQQSDLFRAIFRMEPGFGCYSMPCIDGLLFNLAPIVSLG